MKIIDAGYKLWLSCLGRGIAVLTVLDDGLSTSDLTTETNTAILSAHPNPASDKVQITFNNTHADLTNVSVYDLMRRKVTELMNSNCDKGVQTLHWDFASPAIQNGVYLVSIVNATPKKVLRWWLNSFTISLPIFYENRCLNFRKKLDICNCEKTICHRICNSPLVHHGTIQ